MISATRLGPRERQAAMAAPAEADGFLSHWHQVGTLRLHVRQRQSTGSTATPCVLVHGLAVSHRYLMPTARCLDRRSVYLPDLPGFGLSSKPHRVLDIGQHVDVLAALFDTLRVGPVAILGNSFGSQVAVELARRHPELVRALILVGPTTDPAAATMPAQFGRFLRDLLVEDPWQARILAADIRAAGPRRIAATLRYAVQDDIAAKLVEIRVPTLLVRGARDPIAPQPWLDRAAALTPDARQLVLAKAAHNAVTSAGPRLARAVEHFLADRAGQATPGAPIRPRPPGR
jgi:pimeloyl-ACP methyl ester carboxylesterase